MKNETLKKLTEQTKKEISTKFIDFIKKVKDASIGDSGTFKVVVSTADADRQGETVKQDGWDLSFFKSNPVVMWAHDYSTLPIGLCTKIDVVNGQLVAEGKFADHAFAQECRKLYDAGILQATSVGFIPKAFEQDEHGNNDWNVITQAELLEFSFVSIPANPYALTLNQVRTLKLDTALLMTKGMTFTVKDETPVEPAPEVKPEEKKPDEVVPHVEEKAVSKKEASAGDTCQLDDGTPGILGPDPDNADGPMICIPDDTKDVGDGETGAQAECYKSAMKNVRAEHKTHEKEVNRCVDAIMDTAGLKAIDKGLLDNLREHLTGAFVLEHQRHSKAMKGHVKAFYESMNESYKSDGVKAMILEIKTEISALRKLSLPDGGDTKVVEETTDKSNKGRNSAEQNDFIEARKLLREFTNSASDALERFNKKSKARKIK